VTFSVTFGVVQYAHSLEVPYLPFPVEHGVRVVV
jgi:hypothetical protein